MHSRAVCTNTQLHLQDKWVAVATAESNAQYLWLSIIMTKHMITQNLVVINTCTCVTNKLLRCIIHINVLVTACKIIMNCLTHSQPMVLHCWLGLFLRLPYEYNCSQSSTLEHLMSYLLHAYFIQPRKVISEWRIVSLGITLWSFYVHINYGKAFTGHMNNV